MIKAIQTQYKGYNFRSRLEARWAVFFDAMGIKWQYEPEGFDLGDFGWYLPDFRIEYDGKRAWVEVKGGISGYRDDEGICHVNKYVGQKKTDEFARRIRARGGVMFLLGDIPDPDCNGEIAPIETMLTTAKTIAGNLVRVGKTEIKLQTGIPISGMIVKTLKMRHPTIEDQIAALEIKGTLAAQEVALMANLCEIMPDDIKNMTLRDYRKVQEALAGFTEVQDGDADFSASNSLWEYCAFTLRDDALGIHPSFVFGNWGWCHIGNGEKDDAFDPSTGTHSIKWRTWWPERAYEAARSARFEHGETPL